MSFGLPVICVGNLSVGGTGKSPMVEFLVRNFKDQFKLAILSRGFKRKTKGYCLANANSNALEIGDEPMQYFLKFPEVPIAVGEERIEAIPQLLHDKPETQCVILDDAFQHRSIKAGLNILLTEYSDLFTRDFFLPTGDLRDEKASYKRADIIVVTKCITSLSENEKMQIIQEINPFSFQEIYFTTNKYSKLQHIVDKSKFEELNDDTEILLVTGIANPKPLKELLHDNSKMYYLMEYPDHHIFTIDDWREIKKKFESIKESKKIILTTEKDAMRFVKFGKDLENTPLFVIPVVHQFLFNEEEKFKNKINDFIKKVC